MVRHAHMCKGGKQGNRCMLRQRPGVCACAKEGGEATGVRATSSVYAVTTGVYALPWLASSSGDLRLRMQHHRQMGAVICPGACSTTGQPNSMNQAHCVGKLGLTCAHTLHCTYCEYSAARLGTAHRVQIFPPLRTPITRMLVLNATLRTSGARLKCYPKYFWWATACRALRNDATQASLPAAYERASAAHSTSTP